MTHYEIEVKYSRTTQEGIVVLKTMLFVSPADSIEEARTNMQEIAMKYITHINGTLISIE